MMYFLSEKESTKEIFAKPQCFRLVRVQARVGGDSGLKIRGSLDVHRRRRNRKLRLKAYVVPERAADAVSQCLGHGIGLCFW